MTKIQKIWFFLKIDWAKTSVAVLLLLVSGFLLFWFMGHVVECFMSLGCDDQKFFFVNFLGSIFVAPVMYMSAFTYNLIRFIFHFQYSDNWIYLTIVWGIIYDYFLACVFIFFFKLIKKKILK